MAIKHKNNIDGLYQLFKVSLKHVDLKSYV